MLSRLFCFSKVYLGILILISSLIITVGSQLINTSKLNHNFLGNRVQKKTWWVGHKSVSKNISILVMAGHADSQGIEGSGTEGEAVALKGSSPMDFRISDELFWNLAVRDAVVALGERKGLNISAYDPGIRTIIDSNNELTNWSVGAQHANKGGYPLEIHFDSYGQYGFGSGLIPPLSTQINSIDEALARSFGRYPIFFRGGLGGPRRQIRILEIGKLEGSLERKLRDVNSREQALDAIAHKIIDAILIGINNNFSFNQQLNKGHIFMKDSHQLTNHTIYNHIL